MTEKEAEYLYVNLGLNIKAARLKKDYNQEVFANMLKLSRASIVNIEKGRQRPTLHLLYEICKVTNSNLFDLLPKLSFDNNLDSKWKEKIQKEKESSPSPISSLSEEFLSNFVLEVTKRNKKDDN